MNILPSTLHKRTYFILTVAITIPMLIFSCVNAYNTRDILMFEKEKQLIAVVTQLDAALYKSYESIIREENASELSSEEKRKILNQKLQPIVNKLSEKYPDYGMGYYHPDLNIVAVVPYSSNLLGKKAHPLSLGVYQNQGITEVELDSGVTRNNKPLLALNYPLFYDGSIIGHVWANIPTEDINQEMYFTIGRNLTIIFLFWLSIVGIVRWSFRKTNKYLAEFSYQIKHGDVNIEKFNEIPELIPVIETVCTLRQTILHEYEEKEQVNRELVKLDRLNLVSQMAAGVAHEIRNPMTVVMGYLQRLYIKATSEQTKEHLRLILEELKRVDEIIADFLSLARNKPLEISKQQLNTIVSNLYPLIYADAVNKSIEVILNLEGNLPEIYCNKKEISQLFLNLCRNAIEAIGGKGRLRIQTLQKNDSVELQVEDNGCGIPSALIDKIFDPFFTTKEQGTGLGLAVCRRIVERHCGKLRIESNECIGTKFIVQFPVPSPKLKMR